LPASAVLTFVWLPGLADLVHHSGAGLFASADLLGTSHNGSSRGPLLAPAHITLNFPGCVDVIFPSHVGTFGLGNGTKTIITSHLAVCVTFASCAAILLVEVLSNLVSISIVQARARIVGAAHLAITLTGACVALFRDGLSNSQCHSTIFTVAGDGVV